MLIGLDKIESQVKEASNIGTGDWIRQLRIKDGDIAIIRFISDRNTLIGARFHDVEKENPNGGKAFTVPVYCPKIETGLCQMCADGKKSYPTINLWVYVYYILHKTQNPNIQAGSTDGIWQQQKQGRSVLYREDVNQFMWFKTKYGQQDRYKKMIVDFCDEYGTLCDRDYAWSRSGEQLKTTYSLMPKDKGEISDEIKTKAEELPELGLVVSGKVRSFNQGKEDKSEDIF